jgi:hypothetical protein
MRHAPHLSNQLAHGGCARLGGHPKGMGGHVHAGRFAARRHGPQVYFFRSVAFSCCATTHIMLLAARQAQVHHPVHESSRKTHHASSNSAL